MEAEIIKRLKKFDLFKDAPEDVLSLIADKTIVRKVAKDEVLTREGDPSESLFVIRRGWVKIVADGLHGEEVVLNQCGPGQIVGEMALIEQKPRSTTMIALTEATLLEIKYEAVLEALNQHPQLVFPFLRDMASRLRFANAYVEETIEWCQQIAAGNYNFVEEQVERTQSTIIGTQGSDEARASAFLSTFFKMVKDVKAREEHLKHQVKKLEIEIDEVKRQQAVSDLTQSKFFSDLQAAANKLRRKRRSDSESDQDQA